MSDDDKQGFEIYGKFFPFVGYDEWLNRDFTLARRLTGVTTDELFGDVTLMQQALVAIAVAHESPQMPVDGVVDWVGGLKPAEISEVGFTQAGQSPLTGSEENGNGGSSTATSGAALEPTREISLIGSSGTPGSGTGSPQ